MWGIYSEWLERRLRKQSGCEVLAALGWKPHSGQRGDRICPLKVLTGTSSDDRLCSLSPALGQILTSDLTAFFPQLVVLEVVLEYDLQPRKVRFTKRLSSNQRVNQWQKGMGRSFDLSSMIRWRFLKKNKWRNRPGSGDLQPGLLIIRLRLFIQQKPRGSDGQCGCSDKTWVNARWAPRWSLYFK